MYFEELYTDHGCDDGYKSEFLYGLSEGLCGMEGSCDEDEVLFHGFCCFFKVHPAVYPIW